MGNGLCNTPGEREGGHSTTAPGAAARRGVRWASSARRVLPDEARRRGAGSAVRAPESSGVIRASVWGRHVGVASADDDLRWLWALAL